MNRSESKKQKRPRPKEKDDLPCVSAMSTLPARTIRKKRKSLKYQKGIPSGGPKKYREGYRCRRPRVTQSATISALRGGGKKTSCRVFKNWRGRNEIAAGPVKTCPVEMRKIIFRIGGGYFKLVG